MAKNQLVYSMQAARWRAVQGRTPPVMTPYEKSLSAALSPETPPRPEELKAALLAVYAKFELFDGTVHQKAGLHLHLDGLLASLMTRTMPTQMIKTDRVTVEHSGAVDASGGGVHADKRLAHITLRQRAEEDRAYIESCFGRSLYPPERLRKAEQELCTGEHLGCHLWFASGVPSPEQAPTPEAKHLAEQAQLQADRNRAYYAKNLELHRSVVLRLSEQIRNCILVHQQPNARVARSGSLDPGRVWRTVMDDGRVFRCAEEENHPSFTVDLLLDASASRLHCQEVIAAQGSILAQSLAACGIPVRVSSFCSLRGYTGWSGAACRRRPHRLRPRPCRTPPAHPPDRRLPQRQPPYPALSQRPAGPRLRRERRRGGRRRRSAGAPAQGPAGLRRLYGRGLQRRRCLPHLRQEHGPHPGDGPVGPRRRTAHPERDPGAGRLSFLFIKRACGAAVQLYLLPAAPYFCCRIQPTRFVSWERQKVFWFLANL